MINPAVLGLLDEPGLTANLDCLLKARCHEWLEQARTTTDNPGIQRLINDIHDDLWAIGTIDADLEVVVRDALGSVAAAIETAEQVRSGPSVPSLN